MKIKTTILTCTLLLLSLAAQAGPVTYTLETPGVT